MSENQEIASVILQQLGGRHFCVTVGAKQLVAIDRGLRFRIGRNYSKANIVRITLRGDDTYDMQFIRMGKEVNPYNIMMRYAGKGLSAEEFNTKVREATERASQAAEPKVLKEYNGVCCDQLEELFRDYTKLNTRLF